ncbi:hypothetical protein EP51_33985 [Rhodococcus opacus]|uniref:Uncharacterized protein n=1 Tax=Rhodococcus opacus TaxID=37919 RepID=A0A076ETF1_RHOOP|nr:hypothetical protein EP51_33985 [Rhodococcus opacus]
MVMCRITGHSRVMPLAPRMVRALESANPSVDFAHPTATAAMLEDPLAVCDFANERSVSSVSRSGRFDAGVRVRASVAG